MRFLSKNPSLTLSLLTALSLSTVTMAHAADTLPTLNGGGVAVVDLPSSSAEAIVLDIKNGRFAAQSVGRMILNAQGIDFRSGKLNTLGADIREGNFDNVLVDQLTLNSAAFSFDTLELLNHRRFILDHPVNANVGLKISEESLNRFFSNPKTLEKLEKAVSKKMGNLNLITFSNPSLKFIGKERVKIGFNTSFVNAVAAPMEMVGKLSVANGKLVFNGMEMTSNGVGLPADISGILEKKLNEMIDLEKLGKNNFVIQAQSLNMSGKALDIKGTALLTRLEFGK